jgi:purine-binding chemotaxis protein CheW
MQQKNTSATHEEQLIVFRLGREAYGVDIGQVQGIERIQRITKVPHTPDFVEGVINLRGQVTPVITLRARFGLPPAEHTKETRIVVVRMGDTGVGLVVDAVDGVLRITSDQVEPPSELVSSVEAEYLRGIAKVADNLLILLDLQKVLTWHEVKALETVSLEAA